jgi:hypothetical protein
MSDLEVVRAVAVERARSVFARSVMARNIGARPQHLDAFLEEGEALPPEMMSKLVTEIYPRKRWDVGTQTLLDVDAPVTVQMSGDDLPQGAVNYNPGD